MTVGLAFVIFLVIKSDFDPWEAIQLQGASMAMSATVLYGRRIVVTVLGRIAGPGNGA